MRGSYTVTESGRIYNPCHQVGGWVLALGELHLFNKFCSSFKFHDFRKPERDAACARSQSVGAIIQGMRVNRYVKDATRCIIESLKD